jgi:oligopeptide transport system substrate-binding protein
VHQLIGQGEQVAYSLSPPTIEGFSLKRPVWAVCSQEKRSQEARRLLKEAGYHKDNPLRFTLFYSTSELHEQIAVALASQWKQYLEMVEITFACEEWKVFLKSRLSGHYQIARNGWEADYNEPSALLNNLLSNSGKNSCFYHSPVFDDWLSKALQASSEEARRCCYQQAEAQLAEDVPVIPLFHRVAHRLVKPYVVGLSEHNPMGLFYVKDLYLIQHPQAPSRYRQ